VEFGSASLPSDQACPARANIGSNAAIDFGVDFFVRVKKYGRRLVRFLIVETADAYARTTMGHVDFLSRFRF
jgi:hypothetical protein